jgi:hypothetical protein
MNERTDKERACPVDRHGRTDREEEVCPVDRHERTDRTKYVRSIGMDGISRTIARRRTSEEYVRPIGNRGLIEAVRGPTKYVRSIGSTDGRGRGIGRVGKGESMSGISVIGLSIPGSRGSKRAGKRRSWVFWEGHGAWRRRGGGMVSGELCPEYR